MLELKKEGRLKDAKKVKTAKIPRTGKRAQAKRGNT